jgi:small subunit ribosomal protein S11
MMKKKLSPQTGILCISTTLNNTFVNLTDMDGNTLYVASSGSLGFKGSKKASSYAAQATTEKVLKFCVNHSVRSLVIKLRGVGYSKDAALKSVLQKNFKILQISETTQRPFNGCRQTKKRRI